MWRGDVPTERNPMELVQIKDATMPMSLTTLRISEARGLKWRDVDWLNERLRIERAIVRQHVGSVKTVESEQKMSVDAEMLEVLRVWKQTTEFASENDWILLHRRNSVACSSRTLGCGDASSEPRRRPGFSGSGHTR
jgi:integrase